jgi:enamine deaminase RidA (YjgF/YER057c/UK114 family)
MLWRNCPLIRKEVLSGYPFEETYGYARAVRVGDHVFVSGTTARSPVLEADAYMQMMDAIVTVAEALEKAGAGLRHVVKTVVYVLDMAIPTTSRVRTGRFLGQRVLQALSCR